MVKTLRGIHPSHCSSDNSHSVFFFCLQTQLVFHGLILAACVKYSGNRGLAIITVHEEYFIFISTIHCFYSDKVFAGFAVPVIHKRARKVCPGTLTFSEVWSPSRCTLKAKIGESQEKIAKAILPNKGK